MASVTPSDVIDGVYFVEPDIHHDERGFFIETYRRSWFPGQREMIQGNRGDRQGGAVVGLHYHLHQSDYWYVPFGTARVVLHDLREQMQRYYDARVEAAMGGPRKTVTVTARRGATVAEDQPIWQKTIEKVLSDEQRQRYESAVQQRAASAVA